MTTIAWDGESLAADTLLTFGSNRDGHWPKIAKRGPFLAGISGSVAAGQKFLDWFAAGMRGDPPEMPSGDETTFGVIIGPSDLVITYGPRGWERCRSNHYAMGSGSEFAIGAMAMGATAAQAVEVASRFDTKTGGEISILRRNQSAALELVDTPQPKQVGNI